ncbi:MAG: 16S rRNA (adenine(1518)-N(6)/adenine(1519)-N(6))-dimethyltransferase RsmA [Deltaproteobacteria bacterium]|nr:16S rRNA (adenine(1518)-N(6)/adenine(1519)-N(6))-dimethyltransferase RsmA [Deltaproteobacteria bacterium]
MSEAPREILRRHGLRPKKDWGQNFLGDEQVLSDIAAACSVGEGDVVVELGAGLGHLTRALAETHAQIVAVERDRDLVRVLEKELALPNVKVIAANAADLDFEQVAQAPRPVVAGNLPYQLSSPILFQLLEQRTRVRRAVFLLQKEVAQRISAPPGGRDYGLLSVLLQAFAHVGIVFEVSAHYFHPPPKVDSAVVRIDLLEKPRADVRDQARFTKVVKAAFALRRKTLSNALKAARLVDDAGLAAALARANIDGQRRAETLSPQEFAALERELPVAPAKPDRTR